MSEALHGALRPIVGEKLGGALIGDRSDRLWRTDADGRRGDDI